MNLNNLFKRFIAGKLSTRERYLFYGVIFLVGAFCLERFVFHNIFLQLNLLNKKTAMLKLNYQKAKTLIANKEIITEAGESYKKYLDSPLSKQQNPLSDILSHIESLARKNGGVLIDMKPGQQISKTSTHSTYTIEVGLQGNLSQVSNFIADLQKSNLLIEVERISLTPKEELLQLRAKLSVFVF
jgi:Tfp pilus assembly protein PilO